MEEIDRIPSLSESEFRTLVDVLTDFHTCVPGDWMIVGSISYRLFVPFIRTEPGLRDLDVLVYPAADQDPDLLVSPDIREHFYILHIGKSRAGYYYRLIHKRTGAHVDVFTDEVQPHRQARLGGLQVRVASAERTLFHALVHLLMLDREGKRIEKKTPYNANKLWEVLDQKTVLSL